MMSFRRREGFSEDNSSVPLNLVLKSFFPNGLRDHIDFTAQDRPEAPLQLLQLIEVIQPAV